MIQYDTLYQLTIIYTILLNIGNHYFVTANVITNCESNEVVGRENQTNYLKAFSEGSCELRYDLDFSALNDSQIMNIRYDIYIEIEPLSEETMNETNANPLLVSIRQRLTNTQITLPFVSNEMEDNPDFYYSARRTLCFPIPKHKNKLAKILGSPRISRVYVSVDTSSKIGIPFILRLEKSDNDLLMRSDNQQPTEIQVSPTAPGYFRFEFDELLENQVIEIIAKSTKENGGDICTILAIGDPYCPIFDSHENIQRSTEYKRMTTAAVIRLKKNNFKKGFIITLLPLTNDQDCLTPRDWNKKNSNGRIIQENRNRLKTITLELRTVDEHAIGFMFLVQVIIFIICVLVAFIIFSFSYRKLRNDYEIAISKYKLEKEIRSRSLEDRTRERERQLQNRELIPLRNTSDDWAAISNPSTVISYNDVVNSSNISGTWKRSNRYCSVTCFVSTFYVIPVSQFIYYHWKSMTKSGDFDHCYYNEFCRLHVDDLGDFNHLASNLLYVLFGSTFIAFVYWRSCLLGKKEYKESRFGLGFPVGAYIAMGLSLIMEGVLSCVYHLCPSSSTFQFDVAFMYVISIIIMSTIHQLRYQATPSGTKAFILITVLTIISALFYISESKWSENVNLYLRIGFAVSHIIFVFVYGIGIYYHGVLQDEKGAWYLYFYRGAFFMLTPKRYQNQYLNKIKVKKLQDVRVFYKNDTNQDSSCWKNITTWKIIHVIVFILLNAAASVTLAIKEDFAHYLLYLLILNVILTIAFYVFWKLFYLCKGSEDVGKAFFAQTMIFLVLALILGIIAVMEFTVTITDWNASAAESRTKNEPCLKHLWNFYDDHDLWHFLSAASLFFMFMTILTIDDGLILTNRRNIQVF